ncbi:hypothetical protein B296_00057988 [Ensete ventricosum]|uniref:Uncharacterized protein n=1 Tax=Ensete ventricosum TaxID=4639 RepID=A0A426XD54_ENSVE|nr:hypothetical protein B296_00057988 [Ensete ventricosum]
MHRVELQALGEGGVMEGHGHRQGANWVHSAMKPEETSVAETVKAHRSTVKKLDSGGWWVHPTVKNGLCRSGSALHKLCVCCPDLLHANVFLENSDFSLEHDIDSHRFIHLFLFSSDSLPLSRFTFCNYFKGGCTLAELSDLLYRDIFNTNGRHWSLLNHDISNSTRPLSRSPSGTIEFLGPSLCLSHGVAIIRHPIISATSSP